MYCLIQSHAFNTQFSLSLCSSSEWCPVGNWLLWVPCRSHFPSLSITHAYPYMFLTQKRHWTHHKRKQKIVLIGRHTESALAVGMLGHWSARVTAGNEISQQELIDVCNAWQCFHLRLKQLKGGREHGAQKCRKTKMPKGPLRWKVNCLHKLLLTPEYYIRKVWVALLVICTTCIKWASVFYWTISYII